MVGSEDRWIATLRGRIFARMWRPRIETGQAPIILFHDSLGCIEIWRSFPKELAQASGRVVIAYDRLGFGRSDRRSDRLDFNFVGEEAESVVPQLREQLGFDRFIAFGHSVGGGMAAHCAALHGETCDALVTESAQAFVEDRTREGILEAKAQFAQAEVFEKLRRFHGDKARWVLDAWIDTWLSPDFADWSLAGVLPQVTCPVLIIHGDEDEYGSTRHPEIIARGVRGPSELAIMSGAKHIPHREREREVAERVAAFLRAQSGGQG